MPYRHTNQGRCNFVLWLDPDEPECGDEAVEVDDDPRLSGAKYRCERHRAPSPAPAASLKVTEPGRTPDETIAGVAKLVEKIDRVLATQPGTPAEKGET